MKKTLTLFTLGFVLGCITAVAITEHTLRFAWSEYQLCADNLADARRTADDLARQKLHDWAADKVIIDSNKLAEAIVQTTEQFNLWYYKEGNPPPLTLEEQRKIKR